MDSKTVVIFGAGASKACAGPLRNEMISRGLASEYHIDREGYLDTSNKSEDILAFTIIDRF